MAKIKVRTKRRISSFLNNIQYIFTASMTKRRFWMLNALFPKSPSGNSLRKAVEQAFQNNNNIIDIGCGSNAQALIDLRNEGFDNLYGVDTHTNRKIEGVKLINTNVTELQLEEGVVNGVIFSSYLMPHLSLMDQINLLTKINDISSADTEGFIGPFIPRLLEQNEINPYVDSKNPYLTLVKELNKTGRRKWKLHKSILVNSKVGTNKVEEAYYRSSIPFVSAYVLTGRSLIRKILPVFEVKRDYKERFPFEYFITFSAK